MNILKFILKQNTLNISATSRTTFSLLLSDLQLGIVSWVHSSRHNLSVTQSISGISLSDQLLRLDNSI